MATASTVIFGLACSISPNNLLTVTTYGSIEPGEPFGLLSTSTYTYQHNEAGLPVQEQLNGLTTTFTYQKY
jgi:hypothetical protein